MGGKLQLKRGVQSVNHNSAMDCPNCFIFERHFSTETQLLFCKFVKKSVSGANELLLTSVRALVFFVTQNCQGSVKRVFFSVSFFFTNRWVFTSHTRI